jgi:hypothetical protein
MGNLIDQPRIKFKFKSSCCTTVVVAPDEDEPEPGFDLQFEAENGTNIHSNGTELLRQNGTVEK